MSRPGAWRGIDGILTLPKIAFDTTRLDPKTSKPLDNASIYLGGRAKEQEVDCGLTWEVVREADGSVSKERKAFRPFWRTHKWHNGPAHPDYYYYPGDTVQMTCETTESGKLHLQVLLLKRAVDEWQTTPTLWPSRDTTGTEALTTFSVTFDAKEFGPEVEQEFKRVNAIDQVGNEGKPVQPTKTRVEDAVWHEVWLLRPAERKPMTKDRYIDMRCPGPENMVVGPAGRPGAGGEKITLMGTAREEPEK